MIEIIFISVGLAMDAFTVAITSGTVTKKIYFLQAFKMAVFFGLFQAIMPLLGWLVGFQLKDLIVSIDHWVAFGLLSLIGGRMIYYTFNQNEKKPLNFFKNSILFALAIATSIDALIVGISLAFIKIEIFPSIIIIGTVTFITTLLGVYIGKKFDGFFNRQVGVLGGLILIFIGVKILIEHLIK